MIPKAGHIIKAFLVNNGYDGLYNDDICGCERDDLGPCDGIQVHCKPGYKRKPTEHDECFGDADWVMGPKDE